MVFRNVMGARPGGDHFSKQSRLTAWRMPWRTKRATSHNALDESEKAAIFPGKRLCLSIIAQPSFSRSIPFRIFTFRVYSSTFVFDDTPVMPLRFLNWGPPPERRRDGYLRGLYTGNQKQETNDEQTVQQGAKAHASSSLSRPQKGRGAGQNAQKSLDSTWAVNIAPGARTPPILHF